MEERCTDVSLQKQAWYLTLPQILVSLLILLLVTRDILAAIEGKHHPMALEGPSCLAHTSEMYHSRGLPEEIIKISASLGGA